MQPWSSETNHSLTDSIGDGDSPLLAPMLRGRVQRLKWLVKYVEERRSSGASTETIRNVMAERYGLREKTVDEYVATLAKQRIIMNQGGVWVTLSNSLAGK